VIGARPDPVIHSLYGIRIRTPWPVTGVPITDGVWDVEFVKGDPRTLAAAASQVPEKQANSWAQSAALPDGSQYRRWTNLFEFLVAPDARRIQARTLADVEDEALLAYLLVDALSFSMVRLGWEPLHATAVATDRGMAAFLGNSGAGKSTLAAAFVRNGARLVTDDMLILTCESSRWHAQPGPPRIKLYRDMALQVFGTDHNGIPMNSATEKLIVPLDSRHAIAVAAPVTGLYIVDDADCAASRDVAIDHLSRARAFPAVLAHTAAHYPSEPDRLRRQLDFAAHLVRDVPVRKLAYARNREGMLRARDAVLADLGRSIV